MILKTVCLDNVPPAVLSEVVACPGHSGTAVGFGLALASRSLAQASHNAQLLWVREAAAAVETGDPYGPGLAGFALAPDRLVVARLRTHIEALRAALEGARCQALRVVLLETMRPVDLTASRRLKLAAEKSGVQVILIQLAGVSMANAAQVRWATRAVPATVAPDAEERPVFDVTVLKHPAGEAGRRILARWDHDRQCLIETLSLPVAAISGGGSLAA